MARKALLIAAVLALAALAAAGSAAAATGLQGNRAVTAAASTAERSAAPAGGRLIAPASACPGQESLAAPAEAQEQAMACMVDYARREAGLGGVAEQPALDQSALEKSLDVLRCNNFSHFACGREFAYWIKQSGYTEAPCWRVGENLAWGNGEYGTVRAIFSAWMRSPGHRDNILGDFEETGLSLQVGTLEGLPGTRVWAQHFGSRCE